MSDVFSLARFGAGAIILFLAARSDLKTRLVSNIHWAVMGLIGIVLLALEIIIVASGTTNGDEWYYSGFDYNYNHLIGLVPIAILLFEIFWDREEIMGDRINFVPIIVFAIGGLAGACMVWLEGLTTEVAYMVSVPVMILIGYIFFYSGLLHGGADAKAFMTIAILVPSYLVVGDVLPMIAYPVEMASEMSLMFPYAFLVLMNGALISAVGLPIYMFMKNMARKDFDFPGIFLGYKMDIKDIPDHFVWPLEVVRENEIVILLFPKRDKEVEEELKPLREMGMDRIWVTPKLPFVVFIFLGFLFSFVIGNLMTLIFELLA